MIDDRWLGRDPSTPFGPNVITLPPMTDLTVATYDPEDLTPLAGARVLVNAVVGLSVDVPRRPGRRPMTGPGLSRATPMRMVG